MNLVSKRVLNLKTANDGICLVDKMRKNLQQFQIIVFFGFDKARLKKRIIRSLPIIEAVYANKRSVRSVFSRILKKYICVSKIVIL